MKTVTVRFGIRVFTQEYSDHATVGDVINDATTKAATGQPDDVRAEVFGVEQSLETIAPSGATIVLTRRCNTKGVSA